MSIHGFVDQNGQVQKYDYNDLDNKPTIPTQVVIDDTLTEEGQAADAKAVGDALDNITIPVDSSLTQQGAAADAKAVGDAINDIEPGLSSAAKQALLEIFQHVAFIDENGQDYYDALENALAGGQTYIITLNLTGCESSNTATSIIEGYTYLTTITASSGYTLEGATATATMGGQTVTGFYNNGTISIPNVTGDLVITVTASSPVVSISAVFTQGQNVVYTNDSLDSLRQYLVVTATYSDSTTGEILNYELSGTLQEGTATITASYGGKTDTFTVTCTVKGYLYRFNESLVSSGSEDFNLVGSGVYDDGLFERKCYKHITPTSGTASTDTQYGLYAKNIVNNIDFGNDFTFSCWAATQVNKYAHLIDYTYNGNSTTLSSTYYFTSGTLTAVESGWTVAHNQSSKKFEGFAVSMSTSYGIVLRFMNAAATASSMVSIAPPSSFDTTQWHHYAVTRKNNVIRIFVDGTLVVQGTASQSTIYNAQQIAISTNWSTSNSIQQMPNGEKIQDFYLTNWCKWEAAFDPSTIAY